jgi:hypothetical protein
MDMDEIQDAALGLYRDPQPDLLRAKLTTKLRKLSQAVSWPEFLEKSETLERLGEWASVLSGAELGRRALDAHVLWQDSIKLDARDHGEAGFRKVCGAFGVPPVVLQLQDPVFKNVFAERSTGSSSTMMWRAVEPPVATDILKLFLEQDIPGDLDQVRRVEKYDAMHEAVTVLVLAHNSSIAAYRVRLGESDWDERQT